MIGPADQAAAIDAAPIAVSVIILNYNGRNWLERCLPAAIAETASDCELIVVDNGSSDGSLEFLSTFGHSIRVVPLTSNLGFAAGNNAGARLARGRYLAFLNNDAAPQPGWLAAIRVALDAHPRVGLAASCIVYLNDPDIVDSAGDGMTRFGGAFKHSHGRPVSEARETREVFGACGAACLIRRDLFDQIGGFDEAYFAVHEDVDLSYRCQLLGYSCVYCPNAVVYHAGSGTMGRLSARSVFWGQRNLEWTYVKNTPWPLLLVTFPGHVFYDVAACFYFARYGHLRTFLSAKWHAIRELPRVWRQRGDIQRRRQTSLRRLWKLTDGGWLALKIREKRFDLGLKPSA